MLHLLNIFYLLVLFLLSPWLVYRAIRTGKYRQGIWQKFLGRVPESVQRKPDDNKNVAWFHGVSVGEIHLLRPVIAQFQKNYPHWRCVVSTTTDTGLAEGRRIFTDSSVFYWPFDFSWAVRKAFGSIRPDLVVLAEGELWPNFLHEAQKQQVPVAVINGRLSPSSFRHFSRFRLLVRGMFSRLSLCAVQTQEYADRFRALGAKTVVVTGSVKYDGAVTNRENPATFKLKELFQIQEKHLVLVGGSTQAPEEQILLDIFQKAKIQFPGLRLFVVPRQKDRFDEVARLLDRASLPFFRRSELEKSHLSPGHSVILMDSIGELGALWGLADMAFVGGSLDGKRGGQNMIEAAAYGAAVLFGPHTWNFKDTVQRLLENQAAIQVQTAKELEDQIMKLLANSKDRKILGEKARQLVISQQGAVARTISALDPILKTHLPKSLAA